MAQSSLEDLLRAVLQGGTAGVGDAARQLESLLNKPGAGGTADAVIYSAFPMSDAQVQGLKDKLEARFGQKLQFRVVEDASLIGGIRVVVGDNELDASVKGSIEKMKQALAA